MVSKKANPTRGPMIHIRLTKETHKDLKTMVAQKETTIQGLVEDLIKLSIVKYKRLSKANAIE